MNMKEIEVRIANKTIAFFGFIGAIFLGIILFYIGSKMQYTTQQTYLIVIVLSLYTFIMYLINVKKSKVIQICICEDANIRLKDYNANTTNIEISSYYCKNIIPKKIGFLLQFTEGKKRFMYYIISLNPGHYQQTDEENVIYLKNELDRVLKDRKVKDHWIDLICFLPVILITICFIIVTGFIYFVITN